MAATPTKAYPLRGRFVPGVPHVVTEAASKAEAEALEATGAFTLDPRHAERIPDAEIPLAVEHPPTPATPAPDTAPAEEV